MANTPIADYNGPIASQHTTWRGISSPSNTNEPLCFEGITPFYHSCPRSTSSWLHSPARRCLVSTMGGCLLPPWRPFVVKFCTAESGTVCTVPALHRRRGLCILLTPHTLPQLLSPLCKPIHSIHPLFLSTFILSPSSVRPTMSPWERWSCPELSIILQVQI